MKKPASIYNSRILKLYMVYLDRYYPHIDLDAIALEAGITRYQIEDSGYWFNQEQVDLFYETVVKATGNEAIAREVGRFAVSTDAVGPVKQHALGMLNTSSIYLLLNKLHSMLSRGARVKVRKLAANKVEILAVPERDVQEKPYQCENRLGTFESLASLFTGKCAEIVHDQCVHRGDPHCRYIASWDMPSHQRWMRVLKLGGALLAGAAVAGLFLWPGCVWWAVNATALIALMGIGLRIAHLRRQDLIRTIQSQGNAAEDHIKEIDYRYRGALLVQNIGQATSELLDVNQLAQVVMGHIQKQLDFDRGIIMLTDKDRKRLVFTAGFGFDQEKTELLQKTRFRLDHPGAKGLFIQVFRDQKPVLVDDVNKMKDLFSDRSRHFTQQIGSRSLICLPIVYENDSLGILAVDNINTKRPLTQSDMNLLMGVAYQTAVSIFGAMAYKKLQDSEARYRSLYEKAPTAYFSISVADATIINCNAAASDLLGRPRSTLIGSRWIDFFAPDQENRLRAQRTQESLKRGRAVHSEEVKLLHEDGRALWTNLFMEPFRDPAGKIVEGRCVFIDTTERRRLEEKLRHAQKMEAVGTLAGGVAHDLSNILSAIVSYPDLMLMDTGKESKMYEPLMKVKMAGLRAAAIVQDLLTLARRGVQLQEVININTVVKECMASPEYDNLKSNHPGINILIQLAEQLPAIRGSSVHLVKSVINIVMNAAEAMPDGGQILVVTEFLTLQADGRQKDRPAGDYVVLSVIDNGTGIPEQAIHRIFEPFYTNKVMGRSGTGLGMAIVWATMQDHNGFVDVKSTVGKGTIVRLFFPATKETIVPKREAPRVEELMGHGETILVVEDEEEHREIAYQMLTRLNYKVTAVDSSRDALERVERESFQLVVLDMVLGVEMDGLTLYRRMLAFNPSQKALLISGFSESTRVRKALELGAGGYIRKPFSLRHIASAVKAILEKGQ